MKLKYFIFLIVLSYSSYSLSKSKQLRIAVIDTGFDFNSTWTKYHKRAKDSNGTYLRKPKLCKNGHRDFTLTGLNDNNGHGTHVAGIISKIAGNSNYCLIIIKFYDLESRITSEKASVLAIKHAIRLNVDIINYSAGGPIFDEIEYTLTKKALDMGILFVAAAGNEGYRINNNVLKFKKYYKFVENKYLKVCDITYINVKTRHIASNDEKHYYPATYDPRVLSVQNTNKSGKLHKTSNNGYAFNSLENGTNIESLLPDNKIVFMTGTSQAAAVKTGKIIKNWK